MDRRRAPTGTPDETGPSGPFDSPAPRTLVMRFRSTIRRSPGYDGGVASKVGAPTEEAGLTVLAMRRWERCRSGDRSRAPAGPALSVGISRASEARASRGTQVWP